MPVPRDGDVLCPTGAVVLRGRRGVLERHGPRSTWRKGECTWCGRVVPKGRRKLWCSDVCDRAYEATQPEWQRRRVQERDGGRCSKCGLDTYRLRAAVIRWVSIGVRRRGLHWRARFHLGIRERFAEFMETRSRATSRRMAAHLLGDRLSRGGSWWDMDHVVPIVDGGHPYDLRNLRTLCTWCHADETAEAATRRAERRRGARERESAQVGLFDDSC